MRKNLLYFIILIFSFTFGTIGAAEHDHSGHDHHKMKMDKTIEDNHKSHQKNNKMAKDDTEKCLVMGGAINKKYSYKYKDKQYYFCCKSCVKSFKKDPKKYLKKAETNNISNTPQTCLVMGGKINKKYSSEYNGKTYYFCCPSCIETFNENPEKYIKKLKTINLEAYQFGFNPESIKVKKGDIVILNITSKDVPHGINIKEYDIDITVEKGEPKQVQFVANKEGSFDIVCSVYCGRGHHDMKSKLIVE